MIPTSSHTVSIFFNNTVILNNIAPAGAAGALHISLGSELHILSGASLTANNGNIGVSGTGLLRASGTGTQAAFLPSSSIASLFLGGPGTTGTLVVEDGALVRTGTALNQGVILGTGTGHIQLNATANNRGVLATSGIQDLGTGALTFNGGVLRALASNSSFLTGFAAGDITIGAGGALIDTNGFNIGVSAPMSGLGGLTKVGAGTLTLSGTNTHAGGTTVSAGNLTNLGTLAIPAPLDVGGNGNIAVTLSGSAAIVNNTGGAISGGKGSDGADSELPPEEIVGGDGGSGGMGVFIDGSGATLHNTQAATILGGNAGWGILGNGGLGGAGVFVDNGNATIHNTASAVTGGGWGVGGDGGAGVSLAGNAAILNNNAGAIIGGNAGLGTVFEGVGGGGAGISISAAGAIVNNTGQAAFIGGEGGNGGAGTGGNGGVGVFLSASDAQINNTTSATITGGTGGTAAAGFDATATGGTGGVGVSLTGGTLHNNTGAFITGGTGGSRALISIGGVGGAGAFLSGAGGATIDNLAGAVIIGGNGGTGTIFSTGNGGDGVSLGGDGAILTNATGAMIAGGHSPIPPGQVPGTGGVGVSFHGNSHTLFTGGNISGGLSGDGIRANAITVNGGDHTVRLLPGFSFTGDIGVNAGSLTFNQAEAATLSTLITGNGAIRKAGSATLALSGANTYAGGTTISGGTLPISNVGESASVLGTGNVLVGAAGTLAGSGTVLGDTNVHGTLAPGNSAGRLTFVENLTLASTATTVMELGGTARGTQYDAIDVGGLLALGGTLNIVPSGGFVPQLGDQFVAITWAQGLGGTFANLVVDPSFTSQEVGFVAQYINPAGSGSLVLTAVALLPGDYNQNGVVDAADYVVWREHEGTNTMFPNDPLGGTIGTAQYNQWRANFGRTAPASSATAFAVVPEPVGTSLAAGAMLFAWCFTGRACKWHRRGRR